jgi:Flp pilus assembly protein TadG
MQRSLFRLTRDRRGIAATEFALVAPVLIAMIVGFFDLAHSAYVSAVLQGEVERAGRSSTMQSGVANTTALDNAVSAAVREVIGDGATFASTRLNYSSFSAAGTPERFVDRTPYNNRYDAGECFEDVNANGRWDADRGRTGQGGANDVVIYKMTVTYPRMFPMAGLFGWSADQTITASTLLRNQPYATQAIPVVNICT